LKVQLDFLKHDTNNDSFKYARFMSPLGEMFSISNESSLYCLNFMDILQPQQQDFLKKVSQTSSKINEQVQEELTFYFEGNLKTLTVKTFLNGTIFQKKAWQYLQNIPYGEIKTYADQSTEIHSKKAVRAVGNANGRNQMAIIIPCHRIVRTSGELGGYAGGVIRKKWLIEHEKKYK
jgi:O-6-methylguanine DNA methyltransferase